MILYLFNNTGWLIVKLETSIILNGGTFRIFLNFFNVHPLLSFVNISILVSGRLDIFKHFLIKI